MNKKFNKIKYNIKRLQPKAEDIESNKCTHEVFDKDNGQCISCHACVDPDDIFDIIEFDAAVDVIVDHLESMKMIVNRCMSKKEIKAAQKYFDMIPLLNNIKELYDICIEELNDSHLDMIDMYKDYNYDDEDDLPIIPTIDDEDPLRGENV